MKGCMNHPRDHSNISLTCLRKQPIIEKSPRIEPIDVRNVISLASMHRDEDFPSSKLPFVWKQYKILEDMEQSGNEDIVSWVFPS
jgi:hypothetical protein